MIDNVGLVCSVCDTTPRLQLVLQRQLEVVTLSIVVSAPDVEI